MKHYLMLFGIISLLVLQGASINLRSHRHRTLATPPPGCSSLTGAETLLFDVGDIDGDGTDDFIVRPRNPKGCKDGDIFVQISTGKGDFKKETIDCSLALNGLDTTLTFGDFDGDGREDIIRTDKGESRGEMWFYINNGQFLRVKLPSDYELASDSSKVLVGDFNGDGKQDFIRQQSGVAAQTFLSTCSAKGVTFTKETVADTASCVNIVVGDYNGDKKDDFICQQLGKDGQGSTGVLFLSAGDGKFTKKALPDTFAIDQGDLPNLLVGDFNKDGKTDFIRQTTCTVIPQKPTVASNFYWVDWTSQTAAQLLPGREGSATGTINAPNGAVQVSYTGDSHGGVTNGGFGGWTNAPAGTYVKGPNTGDALYFYRSQRKESFKFSQPVVNPRVAVWSLGQVGIPVTLDFSPNKVTIVSYGQSKEYPRDGSRIELVDGTKIRGYEGNGVIEIEGVFTELNFQKIGDENYYAVSVGIPDTVFIPAKHPQFWTDWTVQVTAQALPGRAGSATGVINTNAGAVQVSYTGDSHGGVTNGGFGSWKNAPAGTFVDGPTTGDALYFNRAQRRESFTFSQPVVNPRVAIWSLGQQGVPVTLDFSPNRVSIVSFGQSKEYNVPNSRLELVDGTKIKGYEGNGIVEIEGTFTELNFNKITDENYYALTVGIQGDSCPATSVFVAGTNGDFTNQAIPTEWNLDGQDAHLYVGNFNCEGRTDFLRQDIADDTNAVSAYASSFKDTCFVQADVFGTTSIVSGPSVSTFYLGDFNGDARTDYIQYWGDSCYEIVTARYVGGCCVGK